MPTPTPRRISPAERRARLKRLFEIKQRLGFVGRVEYRHVFGIQAGGAQYGLATRPQDDLLIVYADAFERDADPEDFSLEAILAHECGHQLLARHPRLARQVAGRISPASEEILASIVGAILCRAKADRDALLGKATVALLSHGEEPDSATRQIQALLDHLEQLL